MISDVVWIPLPGQKLSAEFGARMPARAATSGFDADDCDLGPGGGRIREFIAGPENHLACAALYDLLIDPAPGYGPLVFFGPSGVGKSHLARGAAIQRHGAAKILTNALTLFISQAQSVLRVRIPSVGFLPPFAEIGVGLRSAQHF